MCERIYIPIERENKSYDDLYKEILSAKQKLSMSMMYSELKDIDEICKDLIDIIQISMQALEKLKSFDSSCVSRVSSKKAIEFELKECKYYTIEGEMNVRK